MAETNEADQYLLEQIRRGDQAGWSQFVQRYEGRLLAFARGRVRQRQTAEDLVQETFLSFLQSLPRFRMESSLETYLFIILRRKVIDIFRGRQVRACSIHDLTGGSDETAGPPLPGREPTASWHVRAEERDRQMESALAAGLKQLLTRLRESDNLRALRVVEMVFYAQLKNKEAARLCGMDEKQIALIKHRCLKEVREHVERVLGGGALPADEERSAAALLTDVWERQRLTCPKRSTIGRYILGTLEPAWQEHVGFHLEQLGCRFCVANLEDLKREQTQEPAGLRERIFQSTIGFLRPVSPN